MIFTPVIPGIDQPAYTKKQLANIDPPPVTVNGRTYTYYEAEQRQREMERTIRKTKREIIAAEASGDNDQFTAKSVLLRRQREQYSEFSKAAGLLTRNERTQVAEFGRSAGSKSSWAARKAKASSKSSLTNGVGSGMMNDSGDDFYPVSPNAYDRISNLGVFGDSRDKKIENAMKHVLDNVRDREPGAETLVLYTHNGIDFISETISDDADGSVRVLDYDKPYISIHNHSSGKTFSARDLLILHDFDNCYGIFVIGNNGNMYCLIRNGVIDKNPFFEYIMKQKMGYTHFSDEEFVKGCEAYGFKYYKRTD